MFEIKDTTPYFFIRKKIRARKNLRSMPGTILFLREKHEIGICYQIKTVDTFKAPSILVTNSGLI